MNKLMLYGREVKIEKLSEVNNKYLFYYQIDNVKFECPLNTKDPESRFDDALLALKKQIQISSSGGFVKLIESQIQKTQEDLSLYKKDLISSAEKQKVAQWLLKTFEPEEK